MKKLFLISILMLFITSCGIFSNDKPENTQTGNAQNLNTQLQKKAEKIKLDKEKEQAKQLLMDNQVKLLITQIKKEDQKEFLQLDEAIKAGDTKKENEIRQSLINLQYKKMQELNKAVQDKDVKKQKELRSYLLLLQLKLYTKKQ